jgi:hypothetical protein
MNLNRKEAQKAQKEHAKPASSVSSLRAFVPSRLRVKADGASRPKAEAFYGPEVGEPASPGQSLGFLRVNPANDGVLFSHEGAKARRHEAHPKNPPEANEGTALILFAPLAPFCG